MIDIKKLRENFSNVQASLKKRGYDLNEESFKSIPNTSAPRAPESILISIKLT